VLCHRWTVQVPDARPPTSAPASTATLPRSLASTYGRSGRKARRKEAGRTGTAGTCRYLLLPARHYATTSPSSAYLSPSIRLHLLPSHRLPSSVLPTVYLLPLPTTLPFLLCFIACLPYRSTITCHLPHLLLPVPPVACLCRYHCHLLACICHRCSSRTTTSSCASAATPPANTPPTHAPHTHTHTRTLRTLRIYVTLHHHRISHVPVYRCLRARVFARGRW